MRRVHCALAPLHFSSPPPPPSPLVIPAAGGRWLVRNLPDSPGGTTSRLAFYDIANYNANPAAFNSAIQICTPISSDRLGNLFFGFVSTGAALPGYPSGIPSGLARISSRDRKSTRLNSSHT